MYQKTTHGITITVKPFYLDDQSEPTDNLYVWAYHVRIENNRSDVVQLQHRHWQIIDAFGSKKDVFGEGVVGEKPIIGVGKSFEYTSGTPLPTPSGVMHGNYAMQNAMGEDFSVEIPAFSLDSPYQSRQVH